MKLYLLSGILIIFLRESQAFREVQTANGNVTGNTVLFDGKEVDVFLGIPFAEPPVGSLRFKAPQPVKDWTGTYNATQQPKSCIQEFNSLFPIQDISEDCLYLNIWTPGGSVEGSLKPVMVWIYGGAFQIGSISIPVYDGKVLASYMDVIVVSLNYRLGAFGFLNSMSSDAPGNMGLLDQNLALRWISRNIKAFGGDPEKITIFGESAGSMSVNMHLLSPLSRGLFKRTIMQSGAWYSVYRPLSPELSLESSNYLSKELHCADSIRDLYSHPSEVIRCLRNKTAAEIIAAKSRTFATYGDSLLPVDPVLASKRGLFQNGNLFIGTNTDEGSMFLMMSIDRKFLKESLEDLTADEVRKAFSSVIESSYPNHFSHFTNFYLNRPEYQGKYGIRKATSDFIGDIGFVCPTVFFSERYADRGNGVHMYQFSHRSSMNTNPEWVGVQHGDEIPHMFGYPFIAKANHTEEDRRLSLKMMKIWTDFAKTGNTQPGEIDWPLYSRSSLKYVNLRSGNFVVEEGPRKIFCDYWRSADPV